MSEKQFVKVNVLPKTRQLINAAIAKNGMKLYTYLDKLVKADVENKGDK